MAFSRSLLIKGLAGGLGACTACAGGVGIYKSVSSAEEDIEKLTDKQLIDKAGLNCGLDGDELTGTDSKNCTVKAGGKINVKNKTSNEGDVTFQSGGSGGAKLKVSKSEGYSKNLKFVVDSGDIALTRDAITPTSITKLGQYETYGIVKDGDNWYLSRKLTTEEGKISELGLPVGESYCKLLETGSSSCKLTEGEIKKVKFNGQDAGVTVTGGSEVKLTITKTEDTSSFTDGYRFTFTFPGDLSNPSVKANIPTDFKIKKGDGNALSLEKAWSDDNAFTKKAGLDCTTNSEECTVSTTGTPSTLSVKVGEKTKEGINSLGDGGKIKLEKDQPGYNQGLKFTITTADVTLNGGGQGDISKLEEFETYEITESGGKYYLTRKTGKEGVIKTSLGLPEKCNLPAENIVDMCSISADQAKGVKFDGQGDNKPQVEFRLKIEKTDDTTTYPHGYKFTLESDNDVSISDTDTIKANTNTVFKIKKNGDALTLEKAWDISNVLEKVGLKDCAEGSNECAIKNPSGNLNIKRDNKTLSLAATAIENGKIKFSKDQADYNQGFKFTISDNDVTLTGVNSPDNKLEELETYEITEDGGKYYLTRKTTKEEAIKKSLSIPDDCFTATPKSCSPLTTSKLSEINFDGKSGGTVVSVNGNNSKVSLTVSKVTNSTDFPLGYRFTFLTTGEMSITETNKVKANIPTEFKIKKNGNGNTLSLVKAWSKDSDLIAKVGLENCSDDSSDCNIKTSDTPGLNIKQGETAYDNKTKSSTSPQGKIKLYKEQKGYLEGFKFVIEDNDITLSNTGGAEIKLTQFETYEIEEKEGKYYLSRKTDGKEEKIKKLGLPDKCEWEKSSDSFSCNISTLEELKSVKFKDKNGEPTFPTGGNISVEVKTDEKTSTLKVFLLSISESEIKIPLNGSNGGAMLLKPNIRKEFKITKEAGGNLTLERAFDINSFVDGAGLQNCYDDIGCSLKNNLNVWLDENNYKVNAKVSGSNGNKVTYVEGKSGGYNGGIEFTLQNSITFENDDASSGGGVQKGSVTSLSTSDKFHVMQHEINNTNYCFLSKVKKK